MATFSDDLRKIREAKNTNTLIGIERVFAELIFHLKYVVPSQWILAVVPWRDPYIVVDSYVLVTTCLVAAILLWADFAPWWVGAGLATFILAGTIINMLNVVFLIKVFGKPISTERTLLLFFFNAAQAILTFAIWYHALLGAPAREAAYYAMLVFGTIGYPLDKNADLAVDLQIATDFLLLAIFLGFIVGNVGRRN